MQGRSDGQSIERFAADAERYLGELAEDLKEGRYQPAPVRRVEIPKAGGNPMLKGWYGYFKHANERVFQTLDALIRRRLRALLRKQEKRPGFGRCYADHCRWPNAYFAAEGLFTMTEARRLACQSR